MSDEKNCRNLLYKERNQSGNIFQLVQILPIHVKNDTYKRSYLRRSIEL